MERRDYHLSEERKREGGREATKRRAEEGMIDEMRERGV